MKKKEKQFIVGLIIVGLIILGTIFVVKTNKNKAANENNTIDNGTNQEQGNDQQENNNSPEEKEPEEFTQQVDENTKINTSNKLNEAKEVDGLKFENIQFTYANGMTTLLADVTNNSEKDVDAKLVSITLLDKEGKEIITLGGQLTPMKTGESKQFNTSATLDYSNAYDFKVTIK